MNDHVNPQNGVIRRATVEELVAHRNRALTLYERAHDAIQSAADAVKEATDAARAASPGETGWNYFARDEKVEFVKVLPVPDRAQYLSTARRLVDIDLWSYIVRITDLERLMDREAKDALRKELMNDPPEPSVETVFATLQQFWQDADMIFKRGIANVFSRLDRRFRSHDGWKIGSRVILTHCFDDSGHWHYQSRERDAIIDIERTFLVLDNRGTKAYGGIVDVIERDRRGGYHARQSEHEGDFFKIRIFKNGNAHLWFTRDDLVEKVNKLLGEYYDAPIPHERGPDDADPLQEPKREVAKNFAFYPTPDTAANIVLENAFLSRFRMEEAPPFTVLEPSAGTGNLARRAVEQGAVVDCIELQPQLASQLKAEGIYRNVRCADFLNMEPHPDHLYDRVIMNPPFDRERDIDHVMHALKFLKPDGFLVAIMSAGTEFRETRKAIAFREKIEAMKGHFGDLPPGSFSSVGTNCNTIYVKVFKDGRHFYR